MYLQSSFEKFKELSKSFFTPPPQFSMSVTNPPPSTNKWEYFTFFEFRHLAYLPDFPHLLVNVSQTKLSYSSPGAQKISFGREKTKHDDTPALKSALGPIYIYKKNRMSSIAGENCHPHSPN